MTAGVPHTLYVSHYGFQRLKGAKHWSFLYYDDDGSPTAIQVTGSTSTYSVKEPGKAGRSQSYLGKVAVGNIPSTAYHHMISILKSCPVVHGNLRWNCQDWIVSALERLKSNGRSRHDLLKTVESFNQNAGLLSSYESLHQSTSSNVHEFEPYTTMATVIMTKRHGVFPVVIRPARSLDFEINGHASPGHICVVATLDISSYILDIRLLGRGSPSKTYNKLRLSSYIRILVSS